VVVLYAVLSPAKFQFPQGILQIIHYVLTWGCFLILAGALVGKQQGKILAEQARLVKLNMEISAANERLEKSRAETVLGMATLSEYRDHDTGLHLQRVSQLCRILADELRRTPPLDGYITDEYVEDLVLSSVLHDIGKVGIPDAVLLKPGRLTDEEFEAVKAHAVIGGDALDSVEKRRDGKGYPRGLSGDAIPLSARIVAVADTYDAITSDRVYRAALPHDEAMRRILKGRGTQFDPGVVDALVAAQSTMRLVTGAQKN
jgi:HD-GYP domain-containing protein (c-di-GMP phosphodiesterase class II)